MVSLLCMSDKRSEAGKLSAGNICLSEDKASEAELLSAGNMFMVTHQRTAGKSMFKAGLPTLISQI